MKIFEFTIITFYIPVCFALLDVYTDPICAHKIDTISSGICKQYNNVKMSAWDAGVSLLYTSRTGNCVVNTIKNSTGLDNCVLIESYYIKINKQEQCDKFGPKCSYVKRNGSSLRFDTCDSQTKIIYDDRRLLECKYNDSSCVNLINCTNFTNEITPLNCTYCVHEESELSSGGSSINLEVLIGVLGALFVLVLICVFCCCKDKIKCPDCEDCCDSCGVKKPTDIRSSSSWVIGIDRMNRETEMR